MNEPKLQSIIGVFVGVASVILLTLAPWNPAYSGGPEPSVPTNAELTAELALKADIDFGNVTAATGRSALALDNHEQITVDSSGNASYPGTILASMPILIAESAAAGAVADASLTVATYSNITTDTHNGFDGTAYTVAKTGWYQVDAIAYWQGSAGGTYRHIYVNLNNSQVVPRIQTISNPHSNGHSESANGLVYCTAGQTLSVKVIHNVGAPLNVGSANVGMTLTIRMVSAGG